MKTKNQIINILKANPKSKLDKVFRLYNETIEKSSEVFSNTSELANYLEMNRGLLIEFCRIYRMCQSNIQGFIEAMEKDIMSPEWWYFIELFKKKPIDELVALRREFYNAYSAWVWDDKTYNEQTDTWEKYTGRTMNEITKSIGLSKNAFSIFRMHIKSGRWDVEKHIKKMESENYKELFNAYYLI